MYTQTLFNSYPYGLMLCITRLSRIIVKYTRFDCNSLRTVPGIVKREHTNACESRIRNTPVKFPRDYTLALAFGSYSFSRVPRK